MRYIYRHEMKQYWKTLLLFHLLCTAFYGLGFVLLGEGIPGKELLLYRAMQLLLGLEMAGICFAASAFFRQNRLGQDWGWYCCSMPTT